MHKPSLRLLIGISAITLMLGGAGWHGLKRTANNTDIRSPQVNSTDSEAQTQYNDSSLGLKFSLPSSYKPVTVNTPTPISTSSLSSRNFERSNPQSLISIRHETGLSTPSNLLKRSTIEHIESEIRQHFKTRYKNYQSISMTRKNVLRIEAVDHIFSYEDQDGKAIRVRLMAIPYSNDQAYYFILQANTRSYQEVQADIDTLTSKLQFTKP